MIPFRDVPPWDVSALKEKITIKIINSRVDRQVYGGGGMGKLPGSRAVLSLSPSPANMSASGRLRRENGRPELN